MEVCGGQTHSIVKDGIDYLLPAGVNWSTGRASRSALRRWEDDRQSARPLRLPNVIFCRSAIFFARPGSEGDLFTIKSLGAMCVWCIRRLSVSRLPAQSGEADRLFRHWLRHAPERHAGWRAPRRIPEQCLAAVPHVLVPPALEPSSERPANRVRVSRSWATSAPLWVYSHTPISARTTSHCDHRL